MVCRAPPLRVGERRTNSHKFAKVCTIGVTTLCTILIADPPMDGAVAITIFRYQLNADEVWRANSVSDRGLAVPL